MDHPSEQSDSPEVIEQQMERTRASLTTKVSTLENQMVGTLQNATSAVSETVENVKEAVKETVETVKENVREVLDISGHVRAHPWLMVGGAGLAGVLFGAAYLSRQREEAPSTPRAARLPAAAVTARASEPSWFDNLLHQAAQELQKMGETVLHQATQTLREQVEGGLPELLASFHVMPSAEGTKKEGEAKGTERNGHPSLAKA